MPVDLLEPYAERDQDGLKAVIARFDQYAEGGHPWSYTDTIASFLGRVYRLLDDYTTRRAILNRLLIVGADHNRYYVGDVFLGLVEEACKDAAGTLMVAEVLRDNPTKLDFVDEQLRQLGLPQEVLDVLGA
jgi:hypothetical protein